MLTDQYWQKLSHYRGTRPIRSKGSRGTLQNTYFNLERFYQSIPSGQKVLAGITKTKNGWKDPTDRKGRKISFQKNGRGIQLFG